MRSTRSVSDGINRISLKLVKHDFFHRKGIFRFILEIRDGQEIREHDNSISDPAFWMPKAMEATLGPRTRIT